jgi:hypothetical protein
MVEGARGGRAVFSAADTANEIHGGSQESSPPSGSGSSSNGAASAGVTAVEPPWALNNTGRANLDVIFFNRVPKVGSQMFMDLLHRLSVRNSFEFRRDQIHRMETIRMRPEDEVRRKITRAILKNYVNLLHLFLLEAALYRTSVNNRY